MIELKRELRGLAAAIDFPETPDIASNLRRHLPERRRAAWPWRIALAVAIAVIAVGAVGAGFAVPQARTAILRLFGIGAVQIEFVDRLPEVRPAAPLRLGTAIDPADAPFPLLRSELLGDPDGIYRRGDFVTLLYGTPERVRLLVTEIAGSDFTPDVVKKLAAPGTHVEFVPIRGSVGSGVWIEGRPHVVLFPGGPPRLAANTLIWTNSQLTLRLEGAASLMQAVAIADSME
jgi:hypothetical protein